MCTVENGHSVLVCDRAAIVAAQQKNATQNPWAFQALYLIDKRRTISSSSFWTFYVLHHISAQAWTTSR
jgi:hypothetical protein